MRIWQRTGDLEQHTTAQTGALDDDGTAYSMREYLDSQKETCIEGHTKGVVDGKVVCVVCGEGVLELNMANAVRLLQHLVDLDVGMTDAEADINSDGKVSVYDAVCFLRLLSG